jgi:hypothetical protein
MLKLFCLAIITFLLFNKDTTTSVFCLENVQKTTVGNVKQESSCRETKTANNCILKTCCSQSGTNIYKCTRCLTCCTNHACNTNCKSD